MSRAIQIVGVRKTKELRQASRKKLQATAWIRLDGGFAVRSCTVIDLSETGVKISIEPGLWVPAAFIFSLTRTGAGRRARVKWRDGLQHGAEFLDQ